MATTNNSTATPEWLEQAARGAAPATHDRVALTSPSANKTPPIDLKPKPRPGVGTPEESNSADEEIRLYRCSYDAAALLPSTTILGLVTAGVVTFIRPFVPARFVTEFVTLPLLALWFVQVIRCGYRLRSYRYTLTSRSLQRRRGLLYPKDEPLSLAKVGQVEIRRTRTQLVLGIGDVVVTAEESSGRSPLDFAGVRWPKKFAGLIESTAAAAREEAVKQVRMNFPSATR
jgi:membrane protein YdbS with pleckstrin-like domain